MPVSNKAFALLTAYFSCWVVMSTTEMWSLLLFACLYFGCLGSSINHRVGCSIPAPIVHMLKCPWARHWTLKLLRLVAQMALCECEWEAKLLNAVKLKNSYVNFIWNFLFFFFYISKNVTCPRHLSCSCTSDSRLGYVIARAAQTLIFSRLIEPIPPASQSERGRNIKRASKDSWKVNTRRY